MPASSLICIVLLRARLKFSKEDVERVLAEFPGPAPAKLEEYASNGVLLRLRVDDRSYSVLSMPKGMPQDSLARPLGHPGAGDLKARLETHQGHFAVTCTDPGETMGETVMTATTLHLLAARLAVLGDPLAALWGSSDRLSDWPSFERYAEDVIPAFAGSGDVAFPTRYWVSIQMTETAGQFGGKSQGLLPFVGYELDLEPLSWPIEAVAERLVSTVGYLFQAGPVLQHGETLGATEEERFRISLDKAAGVMTLRLRGKGE